MVRRTAENLKAWIVAQAENLPDEIRLKDIRKIYAKLKPDISLMDFLDIFQSCTGYLLRGGKLKKILRYRDPIICSVAYDIHKKGLNIPQGEGVFIYEIPTAEIFDYRRMLASMITSTLLYSLPFKFKRGPEGLALSDLEKRVAKAIPDAPRWRASRLVGILKKLEQGSFSALSKHDFKLLNIEEARAIGIIAWYTSWRQSKQSFEPALSRFLMDVGPANIAEYGKAVAYPPKVEGNPEKYCLHEFSIEDISRYAEQRGIKLEKLALTHKRLRNLLLHELECDFVPIFFERQPSTFQSDFRLLDTNDLGSLCYSIPDARSEIINGAYKGQVYERLLLDLLTGNVTVELAPSEWHTSSFYLIDVRGRHVKKPNIISYGYRHPKGFIGIRIKRDRRSFAFKPFLDAEGLQEIEMDLLLIHDDSPKHILVGECKFTKRYNDEQYCEGERKVLKLAEFIANSEDARSELMLPLELKVLPALFTSYSGPALANSSLVIKTTLHTVIDGLFKEWVIQALSSRPN